MNVCHVITRMIVGGAQENTLFSARGLAEAGHAVTLVTGPSGGAEGNLLKKVCLPAGLNIVECPYLVREISPWNDWKAYLFLKKFFRENHFDVVHTHSSKAGIIGRFAGTAAHVPAVVHTIHGLAFHPREKAWRNALYVALEKAAAKRCRKIFAVAQAMIDQSLACGIGKLEQYQVVYSGMELEPFLNSKSDPAFREKLGIPPSAEVVGSVARLFPLKGYEELFRIAPELLRENPGLYLLLVGNGPMHADLKRLAEQGGFADRVIFAGLVPPDQVWRYLAEMDILVHLSLREGLPRAAVQALASGKPVVAYPLDGTPEVVLDGKTGRLVPPGDENAILGALRSLLAEPGLRAAMGNAGRELVRGKFSWQLMSDTLIQAYRALL